MKKRMFSVMCLVFVQGAFYPQETLTERPANSTIDQGWYWQNSFLGRWNPFGILYQTKIYYRKALHREQNSFWFANSAFMAGMEQDISSSSRTSLYLYWQPVIAVNFTARVSYEYDFLGGAQMNGPHDDYNIAFPTFTGLNPMTLKPVFQRFHNLIVEISPEFTFGGPAGRGMLALIYRPSIYYFNSVDLDPNSYYYHNREAVILKARDFFFRHDIKLGYSFTGTGMGVALVSLLEHTLSSGRLARAGIFGGFSFEKAFQNYPLLIPYFRGQVGTWLVDRYLKQHFAIQIDTGIKWKFN